MATRERLMRRVVFRSFKNLHCNKVVKRLSFKDTNLVRIETALKRYLQEVFKPFNWHFWSRNFSFILLLNKEVPESL
jgi:hypothetical protein